MINFRIIKVVFAVSLIVSVFVSCTKDVEPIIPVEDNITGGTIRYTVLVVEGGNSSFKSISTIDSAHVSLVMNDSIYTKTTDINGFATFNNLAPGIISVKIISANHTTVDFVVDLSLTDSLYSSANIINASTMVALFSSSGEGTATISGHLFAELDLSQPGYENAPSNIKVSAVLESNQLINFVNHDGIGEVINIVYENAVTSSFSDDDSNYLLTVPASASGLKLVLFADDFIFDQIIPQGTIENKIFHSLVDTIKVISGSSVYRNILYY